MQKLKYDPINPFLTRRKEEEIRVSRIQNGGQGQHYSSKHAVPLKKTPMDLWLTHLHVLCSISQESPKRDGVGHCAKVDEQDGRQ